LHKRKIGIPFFIIVAVSQRLPRIPTEEGGGQGALHSKAALLFHRRSSLLSLGLLLPFRRALHRGDVMNTVGPIVVKVAAVVITVLPHYCQNVCAAGP
jgi:hypothetical protein